MTFPGNEIHPTVIIEGDVRMGTGNRLLPYTMLVGPIELGDDNVIGPHVTIGSDPADRRTLADPASKLVRIGSRNVIRESSAIQKPLHTNLTSVGDDTYLMQAANVSHDSSIGDGAVLSAAVCLAGTSTILRGANLGMGVAVHQRTVVGHGCMVAANAPVVRSVPPGVKYIPGKELRPNPVGLGRAGFDEATVAEVVAFSIEGTIPTSAAARAVCEEWQAAVEATGRGANGPH
jgi:UDP-N-acetylglucosamine acyltransferase